ncbi:MAG: hypothetical protein M3430_15675 [Acidobacteriota bacterium]|nr:hypothetical protein [Acidobacteriota bacterium]
MSIDPTERITEIYIALLNEGTEVYRPVQALLANDDAYLIISDSPTPEDEHWQFSTRDIVKCKVRTFSDGVTRLVAYEKVGFA